MIRTHQAAYWPYRVTILGIDTATTSGWAIRIWDRLTASGEAEIKRPETVTKVLLLAAEHAAVSGTDLVVVMERPWGGSVPVVMALGAAKHVWLTACRTVHVSDRRIISVQPNTWRSGLFGKAWVRAPRDEIRAHELAYAAAATGLAPAELGPDEAAAICISAWGARCQQLGQRLNIKGVRRP